MGAFDEGLTAGRAALARAREAVDLPGEAEAYKTLGILQANVGDYEGARDAFQQALSRCRTLGYREGELTCLGNLGLLSHYQGNLEEALQSYRLALEPGDDSSPAGGLRRRPGL
jgi:tetratricopeptide (TPR) repeat protein